MGRASAKHAPQAPRVGAHDVILTGLDEESDSTNEEMPPLEPIVDIRRFCFAFWDLPSNLRGSNSLQVPETGFGFIWIF